MRINSLRYTYVLILGIPIMHLAVFLLCGFFVHRFIIETYDPGIFLILLPLVGSVIYIDIGLFKFQLFHRCFLNFDVDEAGVRCYGMGFAPWVIHWNEIHTYGLTGYGKHGQPFAFIFLSKSPFEKSPEQIIHISKQRIIIQVRKETVSALEKYLPADMMKRITTAIRNQTDCLYRR